jgi:beta-N-acetylhexosaminidase
MDKRRRLLALILVVTILLPLATPGAGRAQEKDDRVAQLMAAMPSAAKVGQLFLVTFPGAEVTDGALIAELIRDYHVGGVVLLPENGNIVNEGETPEQIATLVGQLQQTAWAATRPTTDTLSSPGPFIPLFVAISQEGNGMPFTSITNGTTPLPSQMALGATWNPAHAETVGQIVGQEMHAMGVNMLLGPSLDVLETPLPESAGDLGVRSFGGEPFWVSKMGQAYIHGVHQGADGHVAVVAKHFPGLGASDRSLNEEVSTVQRTLEKLRQVDLAPFFATAQSEDPEARPDGVLISHIRFRGLEGDRFATTRPISVDNQWLQRLLEQPELVDWREAGGVTISDGLGVRALRRFYDPNEASFNNRRIAREAFLAGNDLLILSQFALGNDWEEQGANIKSTITFFQERYEADPSFQKLVDDAVARILRLKLSIFGDTLALSSAQPSVTQVGSQVGIHQEALAAISRGAVTLLSPPSPDLIPAPPTPADNIVIFTDSRSGQPCATCASVPYIDPLTLQTTILRLYGPSATGQITPWRVSSFTFAQLEEYMSAPIPGSAPVPGEEEQVETPEPNPIGPALGNADWIIFAMLSPANGLSQPSVVRRFLAEYADTLRSPNLIVLAYDAPYYLDATEINKLSAYYVAYSRVDPFIEMSIRAMFGEFAPTGKPPVNVAGINYNLVTQTSPDPNQTILLNHTISKPEQIGLTPEPTAEITPTLEATEEGSPPEPIPEIGDVLRLQTGIIVDHNGHPVPDGTPVQLIFTYPQEALESSVTVTTRDGVAETALTLDRAGQLDISVQTDPVPRTVALQVTVQMGEGVVLTETPEATSTPTPIPPTEPPPTPPATPLPTLEPDNGSRTSTGGSGFGSLILALFGALVVSGAGYYILRFRNEPVEQALRIALWGVIGGLGMYVAYAIRLPGADWLRQQSGVWAAGWAALFGSIVPLAVAWFIRRRKASE